MSADAESVRPVDPADVAAHRHHAHRDAAGALKKIYETVEIALQSLGHVKTRLILRLNLGEKSVLRSAAHAPR